LNFQQFETVAAIVERDCSQPTRDFDYILPGDGISVCWGASHVSFGVAVSPIDVIRAGSWQRELVGVGRSGVVSFD